jgi:hypothetical protein
MAHSGGRKSETRRTRKTLPQRKSVKTWFRRDAVGNARDSRAAAMANAIRSSASI